MTKEFTDARKRVVVSRFLVRKVINLYNDKKSELRRIIRYKRKLEAYEIAVPLINRRIQTLADKLEELQRLIIFYGEMLFFDLDAWQSSGATLKDLCNICNKPYHQALQEIGPERADELFSSLIFVYNLDYLHAHGDFKSMDVDAPLTHAIDEYVIHQMVTDHAAKEAAHNALEQVFPELMENALYMVTDSDGTKRLVDKYGEDAGPVIE